MMHSNSVKQAAKVQQKDTILYYDKNILTKIFISDRLCASDRY